MTDIMEIIAGLGGDVKPKSCDADEELQNHAREAAALSDLHAKVTNLYERVTVGLDEGDFAAVCDIDHDTTKEQEDELKKYQKGLQKQLTAMKKRCPGSDRE